jgi:ribonuclease P protein component
MTESAGESFPHRVRLTRQRDFDRVFKSGVVASDDMLVIHAIANDCGFSRLGISISRKVGNAVVRNYWKRIIRETFRRHQHEMPAHLDLIARPRRGADADFDRVFRSLPKLASKLAIRIGDAS